MRKSKNWIRLGLVLLLSLLAGSLYAATDAQGIDPAVWDRAANGLENSVQLTGWGVVERALPDFCDTSSGAGATDSCAANLNVPAATCPANDIVERGCRTIGTKCTAGGGTGKWCKRCYVKCRVRTCADIGDSDVEGGGEGECSDEDGAPIEP